MASIEDLIGKKKKSSIPGQESAQEKFDIKMRSIGLKQKEKEAATAAAAQGFEYIDLFGFPISPEALQLIPRADAVREKVVGFFYHAGDVRVAAVDPGSMGVKKIIAEVAENSHASVKAYLCSERSFSIAEKMYDTLPDIKTAVKGVEITAEDLQKFQKEVSELSDIAEHIKKVTVTDFMALVVATALAAGASDIHIEAEEQGVVVRYRIDGVLTEIAVVDRSQWTRIINRIKLFSGLKINIVTAPQDGRFTIFLGADEKIEVRVSTIPTAYGESVVMRLLKPGSISVAFEALGIRGKAFEQLSREIARPNGMIITTGPTGSGKTTTLYAVLNKLNSKDIKIITLEDPVEYKLAGINQSQIDKSKEYTFAKGLVSILRQDPDIIMVGEIRDLETAEVAIQAALTGHLMISTIHTNDAAGTIPRFLSMGVKPFLLAPALNAVIGQRLVRKIHEECKEAAPALDPTVLAKVKKILGELSPESGAKVDLDALKFFHGKGCAKCHNSGFKGRIGIYEIFTMSPEIEKVILSGEVSEYQMREVAMRQGMITMAQDGLLKALDGITSVDEVLSVAE